MLNNIIILLTLLASPIIKSKTIKLTKNNHISITTNVSKESMEQAADQLTKLHLKRKSYNQPIYIVLNSPGGSVMSGESFIQYAKHIPNVHTVTIFAASMAHAIVQAIPGKRYSAPHGVLMAHRAKGRFSGQFEDGELESFLNLMKSFIRRMEKRNSDRIGISLKNYKKKIVNEWWSTADQALEENVIDEIVEVVCDDSILAAKKTTKVHTMFGSIDKEVPICPLLP